LTAFHYGVTLNILSLTPRVYLPHDYAAIRAGLYELLQVETCILVSIGSDLAIRLSICQIEEAASSSV
jgi:hypothetical protein